jgi:hypothetical protein
MKYSDELVRFVHFLSESEDARSQIKNALNPSDIVELAKVNGFNVSVDELRIASGDLAARYWTWSGKSKEWCHNFFNKH